MCLFLVFAAWGGFIFFVACPPERNWRGIRLVNMVMDMHDAFKAPSIVKN
ncbi:MAG TPA: hypothetical protein VFV68_15130 [Agriterribacter sp.]|nr:hypothetical protein [Agriterribacter sp.]